EGEPVEVHHGLVARTNTDQKPSWTGGLSAISTSTNPASGGPAGYWARVTAPAMQPPHASGSARSVSSGSTSATTSATATRPPGRSTRWASANNAVLATDKFIT